VDECKPLVLGDKCGCVGAGAVRSVVGRFRLTLSNPRLKRLELSA